MYTCNLFCFQIKYCIVINTMIKRKNVVIFDSTLAPIYSSALPFRERGLRLIVNIIIFASNPSPHLIICPPLSRTRSSIVLLRSWGGGEGVGEGGGVAEAC